MRAIRAITVGMLLSIPVYVGILQVNELLGRVADKLGILVK